MEWGMERWALVQKIEFIRGNCVEGSLHLQLDPLWGESCPGSLHPPD